MLRDYQKDLSEQGLQILQAYKIVYLAMEVRTGKTLTSLNIASNYGARSVLLLTKKKAIASIQKDFEALQPGFDLYVTNYEAVHTLTMMNFDLIVLDEAHCLSQFPIISERTKLVKKICENKPIIYLSGSPTPESFSQIFHQLHVSSFSPFVEYKNFYAWAKDYVFIKKKYYYNREMNDYKSANQSKIETETKHLFLSYTQAEAGFTQMVQEFVLKVKMKESTYWLASRLRARRVHIGKNGEEIIADTEVKLMQKLHQIYSGSVLAENSEAVCFDNTKAKFIAEKFTGKKIAIFYKFRAELEMIRWVFGGKITDSPEEFNHKHDLTFVSQIQSGREGTNSVNC
jgi:superfamily II DNA or RNA helicase